METTFLAQRFLLTLFEFHIITRDKSDWNEERLKDNPPRYYRFLQLNSMLKAMDITCNLDDFVRGSYLGGGPIIEYQDIYRDILNEVEIPVNYKFLEQSDVYVTFRELYDFRRTLYYSFHQDLTVFRDGVGNYRISESIIEYLENDIDKRVKFVDNLLCFMIDPKQRIFDIESLKNGFNYPNVDIREIDNDYI